MNTFIIMNMHIFVCDSVCDSDSDSVGDCGGTVGQWDSWPTVATQIH